MRCYPIQNARVWSLTMYQCNMEALLIYTLIENCINYSWYLNSSMACIWQINVCHHFKTQTIRLLKTQFLWLVVNWQKACAFVACLNSYIQVGKSLHAEYTFPGPQHCLSKSVTADSLDQCSMSINPYQNHGIDPKCLLISIIADQCRSIPINSDQFQ